MRIILRPLVLTFRKEIMAHDYTRKCLRYSSRVSHLLRFVVLLVLRVLLLLASSLTLALVIFDYVIAHVIATTLAN